MKLVRQLIGYFQARGALSKEQIRYLESRGFLEPDEEEGPSLWEQNTYGDRTDPVWQAAEDFDRMPAKRCRGKKGPKGRIVKAAELCARLRALEEFWRPNLGAVVALGSRFSPCDHWGQAVKAIRQASPSVLREAIAAGWKERAPSLNQLWRALAEEGYVALAVDFSIHGPAVWAYRAAVRSADHAALGEHAWILRETAVSDIFNLIYAKRLILQACSWIYENRGKTLAGALRQDYHAVGYWAWILFYNARREKRAPRPPGEQPYIRDVELREHGPLHLPEHGVLLQAWTHALGMDAPHVTPYLVRCYGSRDVADVRRLSDLVMMCPIDWPLKHPQGNP